ncbi:unnamed protein product [Rotaria sordida]|uniref:Uncharacterized protein n=1 Tax=Rotaria sordida TaxID=392033 RepID=A0A813RPW6_9BILA|nr:unnamed protein product [Rotaria sordida]CAF0815661.1 unnamed protein product [Rotaria sordida]CAF3532146.1 unnamed protein product [Rotaria sordida]CAF3563390.1 unnamed protein product [Rotaria sordida]
MDTMKFMVKSLLGLFILLVLVNADVGKSNINLNEQCQALKCNPSTEICRIDPNCDDSNQDDVPKCVYCVSKNDLNQNTVSKTLLASSIIQHQQQQPLAPRLLAKSGGSRLLADNRGGPSSSSTTSATSILNNKNKTSDELSYDDYYEYDEDEKSDKNEFGEEDEYLDDYAEPLDSVVQGIEPIRKLGICPKVVEAIGDCDPSNIIQSDCRFDTDCPGDHKCCEAACGKRTCNLPITTSISVCPSSFTCTLNCQLGYRTDSNGCLLCECQSCPSMDQCNKNCPSGYLKDLFGCDMCECSDQCPPFSCGILCPVDVGFEKSADGCPLCQCATTKSKPTEYTSSCQSDVHCPPGFRCLNDAHNVPMCQAVSEPIASPSPTEECPNDLSKTCNLQCSNGNYLLDAKGCPTCACASDTSKDRIGQPPYECPKYKCAADCGDAGYVYDENGCRTCECASKQAKDAITKPKVECSRVMCRMYCVHGFSRDENGCEICKCNKSPQPCPQYKCENKCLNGYRKDYSGCQTCQCECPSLTCTKSCTKGFKKDENGCLICSCVDDETKPTIDDGCSPMKCNLDCKYGFERDRSGCQLCSCNRCPLYTCRMFCMYGFKKNSDGCDVCECDWTPVAENIQCSTRIPCTGNRVCNLNLKLCELVNPDKVNWFVYDFAIETEFFHDPKFVNAFKNGLINNIATKYNLEPTQITVSSIEHHGMASFQIMPFYTEDTDDFQKKMDQIDVDLNSHEFRKVLPAVARVIENDTHNPNDSKWNRYVKNNPFFTLYVVAVLLGLAAVILGGVFIRMCRRQIKHPGRSESKTPIYDTSYHPAPTEDDLYHAVHAPDGTAYVVVESDDIQTTNDKRALV